MRHDGLGLVDGAEVLGVVRHVLDDDGGHAARLVAEDEGCAAAAAAGHGGVGGRDGRVDGSRAVVQLGERLGEVLGVDELVGRVLETHLPAMGRRGGRRDEEELARIGKREMLILDLDGRALAKVDLEPLPHDGLAIPDRADGDGGLVVPEGDEDAAERLERGPGVDGRRLGDEVADGLEVLGEEDVEVVEVGEEQRVGGPRGRRERGQVGEVEGEVDGAPRGHGGGAGVGRGDGGHCW